MKHLLLLAGLTGTCSLGALSVDLSQCQYNRAIGESERLESAAGTIRLRDIDLNAGEAARGEAIVPESRKAVPGELQLDFTGSPLSYRIEFSGKDGGETRPALRCGSLPPGRHTISFMFVPGTTGVKLQVTALGKARLRTAELIQESLAQWVSTRLYPAAFTDNVFAVESNSAIPMLFVFKNIRQERPRPMYLVIDLPAGFRFEANGSVLIPAGQTPLPGGGTRYRYQEQLHSYRNYTPQHGAPLLLTTSLEPGPKRYPMTYHLEYAGMRTRPYTTELTVIPAIRDVPSPRWFKTGFISDNDLVFGDPVGAEKVMEVLVRHGFNAGQLHPTRALQDAAKRRGFERYWSDWWFVNGFTLGKAPKPAEVIFRDQNGKSVYHTPWHDGLCPVEAYTNGPYFREHVIGYIEDRIFKNDFGDHVIANWEPLEYDSKGCFCNRCRDAFAEYAHLSPEQLRADWPGNILSKYRSQWIRFRSLQHAKLIEAILQGFKELEKKYHRKIYFVPEVAWANLFGKKMYEQYDLLDYLDKLQWVNPWGPYIFQQFDRPYLARPGVHLGTCIAAREMKKKVAALIPDSVKRPKMLAFPHAAECTSWMTTPEAIAYETLAFFVNGWEGSFLYTFPQGYDARYYATMAEANRAIACYEDFMRDGESGIFAEAEPVTPVPGPAYVDSAFNPTLADFTREILNQSMLTVDSRRLDGKILIALGNAWEKGVVFVRVRVPNLSVGRKYVLYSPDRNQCFGRSLDPLQLADGLLLEVPALGWAFAVAAIEEPGKNYGEAVSQNDLEKKLKRLRPALQKSADEDQELIREANEVVLYNFGEQPLLQAGNVTVKPLGSLTGTILEIRTQEYVAELDMGCGGALRSLIIRGKVLASAADGGITRDGFWFPDTAAILNRQSYRFVGWEAAGDSASVTLEGRISAKQSADLRGFVIRKQYTFSNTGIRLDVTVKNDGRNTVETAYRLHNRPASFTVGTQAKFGSTLVKRPAKPVFYNSAEAPLKTAPWDASIAGVFSGRILAFPGLEIELPPDQAISGVYVWDNAKNAVPSAEIFQKKAVFQPGQSQHYSYFMKF